MRDPLVIETKIINEIKIKVALPIPSFKSNWNLGVSFCGGKKTLKTKGKSLEQEWEPTRSSTYIWCRVRESHPRHIGGKRAFSTLCHPCSPITLYTSLASTQKRLKFLLGTTVLLAVPAFVCLLFLANYAYSPYSNFPKCLRQCLVAVKDFWQCITR